jgi:hypothetical protein
MRMSSEKEHAIRMMVFQYFSSCNRIHVTSNNLLLIFRAEFAKITAPTPYPHN